MLSTGGKVKDQIKQRSLKSQILMPCQARSQNFSNGGAGDKELRT